MPNTYPNQRTILVHRERVSSDFLGIKNENWQAASRDLGAHALQLYLYLASNANNFELGLSAVAVRQAIGMARSTFHDQFHKLVDRGYLVNTHGNTYEFYEVPQADTQLKKPVPTDGYDFEKCPNDDNPMTSDGQEKPSGSIEINNTEIPTDSRTNIELVPDESEPKTQQPKVIEVSIPNPAAQARVSIPKKTKRENFVF